jgi:hypothetical protein
MPRNWVTYWMPSELKEDKKQEFVENRNNVINTLGNLAIITQPLNSSISDSAWPKKKNGFNGRPGLLEYASNLVTLKDVLTKIEWDEDAIAERAVWLTRVINDVWVG